MISKEALEEYKKIYREEFDKDISDEDALKQAVNLLSMMNVIYRPLKKEWLKEPQSTLPEKSDQSHKSQ